MLIMDTLDRLMSLIELASHEAFACNNLIIAIDRHSTMQEERKGLIRDLGWVGFEPTTLDRWSGSPTSSTGLHGGVVSDTWLLVGMEV